MNPRHIFYSISPASAFSSAESPPWQNLRPIKGQRTGTRRPRFACRIPCTERVVLHKTYYVDPRRNFELKQVHSNNESFIHPHIKRYSFVIVQCSEFLLYSASERKSNKFGMTWEWVNEETKSFLVELSLSVLFSVSNLWIDPNCIYSQWNDNNCQLSHAILIRYVSSLRRLILETSKTFMIFDGNILHPLICFDPVWLEILKYEI